MNNYIAMPNFIRFCYLASLCVAVFASTGIAYSAELICAVVKLEIKQTMSMERQAFVATMKISNNLDTITLENIKINVNFTDTDGNAVVATADAANTDAKFFIRVDPDSMDGITDIDGSGTVAPATKATIEWIIIPAPASAGKTTAGKRYFVGANLTYMAGGEEQTVNVVPDTILVKPVPELVLDYFIPQNVYGGDDPTTPEIEKIVPFSLGVRVRNTGFGDASKLRIESAQPKIVENEQQVLIGFAIIGSSVNGQPATDSLLVDFGNVPAGKAGIARWLMTVSLSGAFIEFSARYSHADELGGQLTSLIKDNPSTHFLIHNVLVDLAARDDIRDFLALDGTTLRVYESDGTDTQVSDYTGQANLVAKAKNVYTLALPPSANPVYTKITDPSNGASEVKQVLRNDGKRLAKHNYWQTEVRGGSEKGHYLHIFDSNTQGSYTISFGPFPEIEEPPNMQFIPDRVVRETNQISFIIESSVTGGGKPVLGVKSLPAGAKYTDQGSGMGVFDWTPAIGQSGTYRITYTSTYNGLTTKKSATITVTAFDDQDSDKDGLLDVWEIKYFGDLRRDGKGDYDGDGITEKAEHDKGTDPTVSNLPGQMLIQRPPPGGIVTTLQPEMTVINSAHPPATAMVYRYEIYADAAMTDQVSVSGDVAEAVALTAWQPSAPLLENSRYYWRARAYDGVTNSPWVYGNFFVNTQNDPPGAFNISYPADNTQVRTETPILEVTNSVDPDEEPLNYQFTLYPATESALAAAAANPIITSPLIPAGNNGTTAWAIATPLELGDYYWKVSAIDPAGAVVDSVNSGFAVSTALPRLVPPEIIAPLDVVQTETTKLTARTAQGAGELLSVVFELDTTNRFNSVDLQRSDAILAGSGTATWEVTGLLENTRYYWRAKAADSTAQSRWINATFLVNRENEAPSAPVVENPGGQSWVATAVPTLSIRPIQDPDGDSIFTHFAIFNDANGPNTPLMQTKVAGTQWVIDPPLDDKENYYWMAWIEDEHGSIGPMTTLNMFYLIDNGINDAPIIALTEPATDREIGGGELTIQWVDEDIDSDASISLYYAPVGVTDGALIVEGLKENQDGIADSYQWAVDSISDGTYTLYAVISDGESSSRHAATGTITLRHPGIVVTPTQGSTTESGGVAQFMVALKSPPHSPVMIALQSSNANEGSVTPASLMFTNENWNQQQTITVIGVDDAIADGDISYSIVTAPAESADPNYTGRDVNDIVLTNQDNDNIGITVSKISGNTHESGSSATFTVVLTSEPTHPVTINLTSTNKNEGLVTPISLAFAPSQWNSAQTVTVTGVDDDQFDGDKIFSITTGTAISDDQKYEGLDADDVSVINVDDEEDVVAPVITLLGANPVYIGIDGQYNDAGATAEDDIDGDISAQVTFTDTVDTQVAGTYTVTYRVADNAGNAATPVVRQVIVSSENFPPKLHIFATQAGKPTRWIVPDAGPVTIATVVTDINSGDQHTFDWSASDSALGLSAVTDASVVFTPEMLTEGFYRAKVIVSDGAPTPGVNEVTVLLQVIEVTPTLGSEDTDGDGITDDEEGMVDRDNDGIADYLDHAELADQQLQGQRLETETMVVETNQPGTIALGDIAFAVTDGERVVVTTADIRDYYDFVDSGRVLDNLPGDANFFDVMVADLNFPGARTTIVLPQAEKLAGKSYLNVYSGTTGWTNFVVNNQNAYYSATSTNGVCPYPGHADYTTELRAGDDCIQVIVEDGGPNDAALSELFQIHLLASVAEVPQAVTTISPSAGGSGITLVVSGAGFGRRFGVVTIGGAKAWIRKWRDTEIRLKVPTTLKAGQHAVKVTPQGKSALLAGNYTLMRPVIESITPADGRAGNIITIIGEGFGGRRGKIRLGKRWVTSVLWVDNKIKFKVPYFLRKGQYAVTIQAKHGDIKIENAFTLTRSWW